MKLAKKLKKTVGLMLISTMVLSAAPVMAADYDNHWAKEAITKWSDYDVVEGYGDGVFKPNQEVKRSEIAAFIVRIFGLETTAGAVQFTDVSASAWYAQDVAKVSAAGIMQGASGKFNPNGFATRQEVAVTLVNAFRLTDTGEMNFKDQAEIAAWAKEAVAALASNGYAKGQVDNKFVPKANITRAEVMQLLDNIVEQLIHKPGTYTDNITGNVVVNTKDAVLEGVKVSGNVYFAQGIGLGDATLKNTEVTGNVLVAGGGINSIHFDKAVVTGGVVVDTKAPVRLVSKDSALKVTAKANQSLVLTGSFKEVVVPADVVLELKGATVEKLIVVPSGDAGASITIDKDSVVKELTVQAATQIKGDGQIALLKVEASDVTTTITPAKTEVKPGVDAPKDESKQESNKDDNKESNKENNSSNENNGGTQKPVLNYISVKSVILNENVTVPTSALKINGKNITLNLKDDTAYLPSTIETVAVTFENLNEGEQIKTVVDFGSFGTKELTDTVEAGGKVSYSVADLSEQFNDKKEALVQKLVDEGLDKKVESLLNKIGFSLKDTYLEDGSIDTDKVIAKVQEILAYLDTHKENKELQAFVAAMKVYLESYDITINKDYLSATGKIAVETSRLGQTEYTVTIIR